MFHTIHTTWKHSTYHAKRNPMGQLVDSSIQPFNRVPHPKPFSPSHQHCAPPKALHNIHNRCLLTHIKHIENINIQIKMEFQSLQPEMMKIIIFHVTNLQATRAATETMCWTFDQLHSYHMGLYNTCMLHYVIFQFPN